MPTLPVSSEEPAARREIAVAATVQALPQMLDRREQDLPAPPSEAVVSEGVGGSVAMVFAGATASSAVFSSDRASTRVGTIRIGGPMGHMATTATVITRRRVPLMALTGRRLRIIWPRLMGRRRSRTGITAAIRRGSIPMCGNATTGGKPFLLHRRQTDLLRRAKAVELFFSSKGGLALVSSFRSSVRC